MKDLFKGCWTVPNLLSLFRLLLVPPLPKKVLLK